jgi:GNAT superfamily N-acetyltransferase
MGRPKLTEVVRSGLHNRKVEIRPASPELWAEIADLFGSTSTLRWCWCQWWRKRNANWTNTTPEENSADLRALVEREGPAPGLVALEDGRAVGWVGLGPREDFPRLGTSRTIPQLPGDAVWSVNCFVVAKGARRTGVAGALLEAAVAYAREHGAAIVEGYPVRVAGGKPSAAGLYTGTEGMFERGGFEVAGETTSGVRAGTPRVVMRRQP